MVTKKVVVNDRMQRGYTYLRTVAPGTSFDTDFKPDLTPQQMLELGVFGGVYMRDCKDEFPPVWFERAKLASGKKDADLNYFGIHASQPLSVWQHKGWMYEEDPRGWLQWYCRYYMGRRCLDDERQIKRWRAMKRHVAQVRAHCIQGDQLCRRKQRQALLHWAYDSRWI